ncbi:putative Heterokaryon incompatibility domain-containing protein [Seiridium unicorne]|uniref:Heterokaryon incompatibility domain-containing protein n=1 Tax=Seiridium unicorne TaxID=138068 RepID=A0ABR2VDC1_9PEZI
MVKPSTDDVKQSAKALGALCVNPAEGYAALSHVWSQGLGSDKQNRGLDRSLLDQVFDLVEPLKIRWIWTDSLAIPGRSQSLSLDEEEIKAKLINAMSDIYRLAQKVIVIDALVLKLDSGDPLDVAAITCLGSWMIRVWTYREIKLATSTVIARRAGFVGFETMTSELERAAKQETGDDYKVTSRGKYPSLYKTITRLQSHANLGVSLPDISLACGDRCVTDSLDYAQALLPTLNIRWHMGDTITDVMRRIYEAKSVMLPGWFCFMGLREPLILGGHLPRSLDSWIVKLLKPEAGTSVRQFLLELQAGRNSVPRTVGFLSQDTVDKTPESVKEFEMAVQNGTGYLLSDELLTPKAHFSRVGLIVERVPGLVNFKGWVCCTIALGETEEGYNPEMVEWLTLHESRVSACGVEAKAVKDLDCSSHTSAVETEPPHLGFFG